MRTLRVFCVLEVAHRMLLKASAKCGTHCLCLLITYVMCYVSRDAVLVPPVVPGAADCRVACRHCVTPRREQRHLSSGVWENGQTNGHL